jgi:hypothetical protein
MQSLSRSQLEKIASFFVEYSAEQRELAALALAGDAALARRALDWLPEAFGLLLAGHVDGLELPTVFSAKNHSGAWVQFPFNAEPMFADAIRIAVAARESGSEELFNAVVSQSSTVPVLTKALNSGQSLKGGKLSGPALIGVPAETYTGAVREGLGSTSPGV